MPSEKSTASQVDSHVSHSQLQAKKDQQRMTVISGQKCSELYKRQGPLGSLVKMLLTSSTWHSHARKLTWKVSATPCNHLLFQLVPSMLNIEGIECGLLPTLTVMDSAEKPMPPRKKTTKESGKVIGGQKPPLISVIGGKINPEWAEQFMGFPVGWTNIESKE